MTEKLRAKVHKGRIILDAPTSLPEGTVLDLVIDDDGDDLTDDERAVLHEAIERSVEEDKAGRARPAADVIRDLRQRR